MNLLTKLFGSYSKKELKRIEPLKQAVLALDDKYTKMTDEELKGQTAVLKERLSLGSSLDDILPEAFATCREAMWRVLSIKPFPVQIIGGIILHQGRIAEMKTGEGKTFTAALPAYLNALSGKGVHIVTVNDYLAKYQGEMMARVFNYLGLTVGLAIPGMEPDEKKKAYACDITYATNNEIGFDYLRDNMVTYKERKVQRGHNFAIVDEVDSILIDEARTPLIISGMGDKSTQLYDMAESLVARMKKYVVAEVDSKEEEAEDIDADYVVDEKAIRKGRLHQYMRVEGLGHEVGFADLIKAADEAEAAGVAASIVNVNDERFLSPDSMIEEICAACEESGQPVPETLGELMHCVYESLALCYREAVEGLSQLAGHEYASINIVGGGCRDGHLNRRTAEVCGLPVYAGPGAPLLVHCAPH